MKEATLVFPVTSDSVLLGLKKRGFGEGRWNGFGGKVESESVTAAAARELEEECGLIVEEKHLVPHGIVVFSLPDVELRVHIFTTDTFSGMVRESEEMRPEWYAFENIPYDSMWEDDRHWLPYVLEGKTVNGRFVWEGTKIVSIELEIR